MRFGDDLIGASAALVQPAQPAETELRLEFARQRAMPEGSEARRAESTLNENEREARNLRKAFGDTLVAEVQKTDAYAYQDGKLRRKTRRSAKANKELR